MDRWKGRVALVTGASAGIGAGLTRELVKYGINVAVCARNFQRLEDLKAELKNEPGEVFPIKCDVRQEDQILAMFKAIKDKFGGVDICINNAGVGHNAPLMTGKTEEWRELLEVNVLALCICTREALASMKERNVEDGHIIHISSMSGHRLTDKSEHFYAGTKTAVRVFTEGLRRELIEIKSHTRVTAISPGNIETEFLHRMYANDPAGLEAQLNPGFKRMDVKDIVDAAIYALGAPRHVQEVAGLLQNSSSPLLLKVGKEGKHKTHAKDYINFTCSKEELSDTLWYNSRQKGLPKPLFNHV